MSDVDRERFERALSLLQQSMTLLIRIDEAKDESWPNERRFLRLCKLHKRAIARAERRNEGLVKSMSHKV